MTANNNVRVPDSNYGTTYPYNVTYLTEGGHQIELDSSPGSERIRIAHKAGNYQEIGPDGRHVQVHVGHKYSYSKGGETVTHDHNVDSKQGGVNRSSHGGDSYKETNGDHNTVHSGDHIHATLGAYTHMVKGNKNQVTQGHDSTKISGDSNHYSSGTTTIKSGGSFQVTSEGGKVIITAPGCSITMSGGNITIKASKIILDGETHLGGDGGQKVVQATDKDTAGNPVPSPKTKKVFMV